jgi:hypothetical protein
MKMYEPSIVQDMLEKILFEIVLKDGQRCTILSIFSSNAFLEKYFCKPILSRIHKQINQKM